MTRMRFRLDPDTAAILARLVKPGRSASDVINDGLRRLALDGYKAAGKPQAAPGRDNSPRDEESGSDPATRLLRDIFGEGQWPRQQPPRRNP